MKVIILTDAALRHGRNPRRKGEQMEVNLPHTSSTPSSDSYATSGERRLFSGEEIRSELCVSPPLGNSGDLPRPHSAVPRRDWRHVDTRFRRTLDCLSTTGEDEVTIESLSDGFFMQTDAGVEEEEEDVNLESEGGQTESETLLTVKTEPPEYLQTDGNSVCVMSDSDSQRTSLLLYERSIEHRSEGDFLDVVGMRWGSPKTQDQGIESPHTTGGDLDVVGRSWNSLKTPTHQDRGIKSHSMPETKTSLEMIWTCDHCGKVFKTRHDRDRHRRTHLENKPLQCSVCWKGFHRADHLKEHFRIHSGEKPYRCDQCGQCFRQRSAYKVHMKQHGL